MKNSLTMAFFSAARAGEIKKLKALIPLVDVLHRDAEGRTALMLSAGMGHDHCVDFLLSQIDPKLVDFEKWTALMRAAVLVANTCPVRRLKCLKLLVPYSDIDAANSYGSTALMCAIKSRYSLGVDYLAMYSNLSRVNIKGQSALDIANYLGTESYIDILV
ncbi:ankyrin repeat domain-containing protein [Duganella qianjiadongensis]|uniref:Ankyrin repeat domain-containing protein n=1 Tax=Duganella qianjiadongensis TaxID=2692176 RepID=A0ABW9VSY3_9BURK|nr:ankyrin repeat domain-containing protein [Duganella qianjiadongensis]MYM42199.1 hypothetical protein [Duganella qianjiadongensis]